MATKQGSPERLIQSGEELHGLISDLYPICRSITGDGVRRSLRLLQQAVPLDLPEVPSGSAAFDWTVPDEWNIREAWIADPSGRRIVDFADSNLHVVNYSEPVDATFSLEALRPHLHSLPDHPDWIPYRTSYYRRTWGFCLKHSQLESLGEGDYRVRIDSTLAPGSMTYGELVIPGHSDQEVLFSSHCCHPSLANDNLTGMVLGAALAQHLLSKSERHYTYRFLWAPGTIGAIVWLARHEALLPRIRGGLVLSCLGDGGAFHYKRSRHERADIDRVVEQVLKESGREYQCLPFVPLGYDERQYGSPGIDLSVGCLMRTPNGDFPEYHTSADNLDLVSEEALGGSLDVLKEVVGVFEGNHAFKNLAPKCEPQLGKRGLYRSMGGTEGDAFEAALLWVLNQSDGCHTLLDIAERSKIGFRVIQRAAEALGKAGLLEPVAVLKESADPR